MDQRREFNPAEPRSGDVFDRIIGAIDGLPGVTKARSTAVTSILPIIGNSQTYIVQTYKDDDEGFYVFLQMVDAEGRARIAIPPKVAAAIYRQRDALIKSGRRRRSRERWEGMSADERRDAVSHLRRPKAG